MVSLTTVFSEVGTFLLATSVSLRDDTPGRDIINDWTRGEVWRFTSTCLTVVWKVGREPEYGRKVRHWINEATSVKVY